MGCCPPGGLWRCGPGAVTFELGGLVDVIWAAPEVEISSANMPADRNCEIDA